MSSLRTCRLCGDELTHTFVDLGMSPLCESYIPHERLDEPETFYPLHVRLCRSCLLVQLPAYVPGEDIFSDYAYFSSYSDSWVAHAKRYASAMVDRLGLDSRQPGHRGGEQRRLPPAALPDPGDPGARGRARGERGRGRPVARHSDRRRVPVPRHRSTRSPNGTGAADLVVANNVFAHVPDIRGFAGGLRALVKDTGIGDARVPAPPPSDRAAAIRHHLPRALLVSLPADRLPSAARRRAARGRRR